MTSDLPAARTDDGGPLAERLATAVLAPIAAGGNITSSQPVPAFFTISATRQNSTPHIIKPPNATS